MLCIVDPDPEDRHATSEFICRIGYQVEEYSTAESLLQDDVVARDAVAVVAELDLPGMGGLELAQALRRRRPDMPVIILTRSMDINSAVQAHKNKVDAYIPKPFVERQLASCLVQLVGDVS